MPWSKEALEEIYPEPDGYALVHYRQPNGSNCYWGPFKTLDELKEWASANKVDGAILALYRTVDWRR